MTRRDGITAGQPLADVTGQLDELSELVSERWSLGPSSGLAAAPTATGWRCRPCRGWFRVRMATEGAGVRVTVDDEGPGVAAEHRSEVFERFWRAQEARSLPGSGLGLSIVAEVAAAHGGAAAVEQAPGRGARAVLLLPGAPA